MTVTTEYNYLLQAANYIAQQTNNFKPEFGIILGTGLGALVNEVKIAFSLPYEQIPGFPVANVESHNGRLIFGQLGERNVVVMQGRFHFYEGYSMQQVVMPVRVMKLLGIQKLFISNAAGGLNPGFDTSDLMMITDHINLQPTNPLIGKNISELGPRFPDMMETYDAQLLQQAKNVASALNINLRQGVYASVPGPMLETPAEYRYLTIIGADAVGMSTVHEAIAARHMELPVFALSVITDMCVPGKLKKVQLAEILAAASKAEPAMTRLIEELIRQQPIQS